MRETFAGEPLDQQGAAEAALDLAEAYKARAEKAEAERDAIRFERDGLRTQVSTMEQIAKSRERCLATTIAERDATADNAAKMNDAASRYLRRVEDAERQRDKLVNVLKEVRESVPRRLLGYTTAGVIKKLVEELAEATDAARSEADRVNELTLELSITTRERDELRAENAKLRERVREAFEMPTPDFDDDAIDQEAGTDSVWELKGKVESLEFENANLRDDLAAERDQYKEANTANMRLSDALAEVRKLLRDMTPHVRIQFLTQNRSRIEALTDGATMGEAHERILRDMQGEISKVRDDLAASHARLDQRQTELLEANGRYLQRARDAEAELAALRAALVKAGEALERAKFVFGVYEDEDEFNRVFDALTEIRKLTEDAT